MESGGRSGERRLLRRDRGPGWLWPVLVTCVLAVIIVACTSDDGVSTSGTGGSATSPAGETTTSADGGELAEGVDPTQDFEAQADDFVNVNDMTEVRGFFVDNRLGYLDEAIAVAESPTGGVYPPGTIIQLVPQEAMVKRAAGHSPEFADWEFFVLNPTPEGTEIVSRGETEVMNRFGGSCATCHAKADVEWSGDRISVEGSLPVVLADYDIEAISIPAFVAVDDHGTMEFLLLFERA